MRSLWGKAPFMVEMRELKTPVPGPGEVLIQVKACGICGTDLHFLRHNSEWTPLGHEVVGLVAEVGPNVDGWRGGESVIVENNTGCGVCPECKNGRALYCTNIYSYMNDRAGFADFLLVRSDMIQPYDARRLTHQQATLAEPLTVALDLLQRVDPDMNDEVAVFGHGPIGLLAVRLAKLRGARRVFLTGSSRASEHSSYRMKIGAAMGADVILSEPEDDIASAIKALVPNGVDRVLITAPPKTLPLAVDIARFGAMIGLIGIEFGKGGEVSLDVNAFHFKKLQLRASHAIPNHYFPIATDLLARRAVDPELLLSHTFPLDAYKEAFAALNDREQATAKIVLVP